MATMTASKPETKRGFPHRCPLCGQEDALRVNLADTATLTCSECEDEVTPDDIRQVIGQWQAALAWLETAPPVA